MFDMALMNLGLRPIHRLAVPEKRAKAQPEDKRLKVNASPKRLTSWEKAQAKQQELHRQKKITSLNKIRLTVKSMGQVTASQIGEILHLSRDYVRRLCKELEEDGVFVCNTYCENRGVRAYWSIKK